MLKKRWVMDRTLTLTFYIIYADYKIIATTED